MMKHKFFIFICLISAFIFISTPQVNSTDTESYLFRYKKVKLKYHSSDNIIYKNHIDYQRVIAEYLKYTSSEITYTDGIGGVNRTDTVNHYAKNEQGLDFEQTLVELTGFINRDSLSNENRIELRFNETLTMPDFSRSAEFWVYSSLKPLDIILHFKGNNKFGADVLRFKHKIKINHIKLWYLESFNLLADSSSKTIEELRLTGIDFVFSDKSVSEDNFELLISEINCLNVIKNPEASYLEAKRRYVNFEDDSNSEKWNIRHGINPYQINDIGAFTSDDSNTANIQDRFFDFDGEKVDGHDYLLIDFGRDYIVPMRNRLSILVRGRGMGEEISFILEDTRREFYELSTGYMDHKGWLSFEIEIPTNYYLSFFEDKSGLSYVRLCGLKIDPGYDGKIDIAVDDISSNIPPYR